MNEESESAFPASPPIRSILKKVSSDGVIAKKTGKTISFDSSLMQQWAQEDSKSKLESLKESAVGVASNGEPSPSTSSVEVRGSLEVADGEGNGGKPLKSSKLKKAIKTRVGSVLRNRSSRAQVEEGVADLEASGSGFVVQKNKREERARRRASDISASVEYPSAAQTHSLPRMRSLDSTDLFYRNNRSLRSRIAKFGRHFRLDSHRESTDDALPVLTKVTPLGGLCV